MECRRCIASDSVQRSVCVTHSALAFFRKFIVHRAVAGTRRLLRRCQEKNDSNDARSLLIVRRQCNEVHGINFETPRYIGAARRSEKFALQQNLNCKHCGTAARVQCICCVHGISIEIFALHREEEISSSHVTSQVRRVLLSILLIVLTLRFDSIRNVCRDFGKICNIAKRLKFLSCRNWEMLI